jgi:hypothetical protein
MENYKLTPEHKSIFLKELEKKVGKGSISNWTDFIYIQVCDKVEERTGQGIHPSTLKRITGKIAVKDNYIPNFTTLNILANYLGYESIDSFIDLKSKPVRTGRKKPIFYISLIISIIIIIVLLILLSPKHQIQLEGRYLEGEIPTTVIVNYQIKDNSDYTIQFGDKRKVYDIDPELPGISNLFDYPGYYPIRVASGKSYEEFLYAHITHPDWVGKTFSDWDHMDAIIHWSPINSGHLNIPVVEAREKNRDTTQLYFTEFSLAKDFSLNLDNIEFETAIKYSPGFEDEVCKWGQYNLVGEHNKVKITISPKGCSRWNTNQFSEIERSGSQEDNSMFSTIADEDTWIHSRLVIRDHKFLVFIDGKNVFTTSYEEDLGKLKEIRFRFNRSGYVDYYTLSNLEGDTLLFDDFNR